MAAATTPSEFDIYQSLLECRSPGNGGEERVFVLLGSKNVHHTDGNSDGDSATDKLVIDGIDCCREPDEWINEKDQDETIERPPNDFDFTLTRNHQGLDLDERVMQPTKKRPHVGHSRQKTNSKPDPSQWKRFKCQQLRNSGKAYVSIRNNKEVPEKCLKDLGEHECRLKCTRKFTEDDRRKIFDSFWSLGDFNEQNAFIGGCVQQIGVRRRRSANVSIESRTRTFSRKYFLTHTRKGALEVCKIFLLGTLSISNGRLDRLLKKQIQNHGIPQKDQRGKASGSRSNVYAQESLDFARQHIASFAPAGNNSYKRQQCVYLEAGVTYATMYASYVTKCEESWRKPIKQWKYQDIQKQEFNIRLAPTHPAT